MKHLSRTAVLTLIVSLFFTACSKSDSSSSKTKTELITQSSWKFSNAKVSGTDVSAFLQACQKDNILVFAGAGTDPGRRRYQVQFKWPAEQSLYLEFCHQWNRTSRVNGAFYRWQQWFQHCFLNGRTACTFPGHYSFRQHAKCGCHFRTLDLVCSECEWVHGFFRKDILPQWAVFFQHQMLCSSP